MKLADLHPRRFFLETWRRMDEEAEAERAARKAAGKGYDVRPLIAFASGALFLTLMEYWGMPDDWQRLVRWCAELQREETLGGDFFVELDIGPYGAPAHPFWHLLNHTWWALWRVLGFFLCPVLVIKLSGGRVRDQYLSARGLRDHAWVYGVSFAVVLVAVVAVSYTEGFSTYYPFYRKAHRSWLDFGIWELLYMAQFFSLEFFFRGWWLRAGKTMLGSHAIFAMIPAYVMIHFGKEMAETVGATFAGVFLGTLAMRTRSIWGGVAVHCLVAVSMDVAAMIQTSGLPTRWLP